MTKRTKTVYTKEQMMNALELCEEMRLVDVSRELKIPISTVRYWKKNLNMADLDPSANIYQKKFLKIETYLENQIDVLTKRLERVRMAKELFNTKDFLI